MTSERDVIDAGGTSGQPTGSESPPPHAGARVAPIPPPLYYGAAFAAGLVLRGLTAAPLAMGDRPTTTVVGGLVLATGGALALAGVAAVVRHRTTIIPHHAVSTLVSTGPYRFTRNPMYTGLAIGYIGATLLVGTWWPLATLPLALLAIRNLVIRPEERYLAGRFGRTYAEYRARVRRWL